MHSDNNNRNSHFGPHTNRSVIMTSVSKVAVSNHKMGCRQAWRQITRLSSTRINHCLVLRKRSHLNQFLERRMLTVRSRIINRFHLANILCLISRAFWASRTSQTYKLSRNWANNNHRLNISALVLSRTSPSRSHQAQLITVSMLLLLECCRSLTLSKPRLFNLSRRCRFKPNHHLGNPFRRCLNLWLRINQSLRCRNRCRSSQCYRYSKCHTSQFSVNS